MACWGILVRSVRRLRRSLSSTDRADLRVRGPEAGHDAGAMASGNTHA